MVGKIPPLLSGLGRFSIEVHGIAGLAIWAAIWARDEVDVTHGASLENQGPGI